MNIRGEGIYLDMLIINYKQSKKIIPTLITKTTVSTSHGLLIFGTDFYNVSVHNIY